MRVTSETKEATRQAILDATRKLLMERGWEKVGTREIASEAGIANGTLFNYFANKEAIVAELMAEALAGKPDTARKSVEEQLFALIAGGLRRLRPYRAFLPFVLGSILTTGERLRAEHLARVECIVGRPLPSMTRHLYWSLYSGILTFWASDDSPKQVETLAFIDHSVALFRASLKEKDGGV